VKLTLLSQGEVIGTMATNSAGMNYSGVGQKVAHDTIVKEPGTFKVLTPADGDHYLTVLAQTLEPPYLYAQLAED
jgi:hypothetical protein